LLHSWNKRLQRKFLKLLLENVFQGQIIKDWCRLCFLTASFTVYLEIYNIT
jgi:hypothetical protein